LNLRDLKELPINGNSDAVLEQLRRDLNIFRSIQPLNVLHNYLNAGFMVNFTLVTSSSSVVLIFGTLRGYGLISTALYILLPSGASFATFVLVFFYGQQWLMVVFSEDLIHTMRQAICIGLQTKKWEQKILLSEVKAMRSIKTEIGQFGFVNLNVSLACLEEIFNYVLLLLTY